MRRKRNRPQNGLDKEHGKSPVAAGQKEIGKAFRSSGKGAERIKNESLFEALFARARNESPPSVDVAGRVIAILNTKQNRIERMAEKPLLWLAAASSALAVPAVVIAIIVYNASTGPLYEISQAIAWVAQ